MAQVKILSFQKIFLPTRLLFPIKLLVCSYLSSKNRKFVDIHRQSYLLEKKSTTTEEIFNFTSAINTETTPADTNKKSGIKVIIKYFCPSIFPSLKIYLVKKFKEVLSYL